MVCPGAGARPHIIALVPVRDEQWTLRRCLETASVWADHIIVADQFSRDRSVEIAQSFAKVVLIRNRDREYSEVSRQRQLIEAARLTCGGPRVLLGIDADEILGANVVGDPAWEAAIRSAPGTVIGLDKVILRSEATYILDLASDRGVTIPVAYADDDATHEGAVIHTTRVPEPAGAPRVDLPHIPILHFNLCNTQRSVRKDRWYQCFERVNDPPRDVVEIRRRYDWVERQPPSRIRPVRPEWYAGWRERGIDLASDPDLDVLWSEWDMLRMFDRYGTKPFRFFDLWSVDWEALRLRAKAEGIAGAGNDPIVGHMHIAERVVRRMLARQPPNRWLDGILRRVCKWMDGGVRYHRHHGATAQARVESRG